MKEFFKQNLTLVLAFALPTLLIVGVALSTYLPALLVKTNYNFIYSACIDERDYYYYDCDTYLQNRHTIVNGKLVINNVSPTLELDMAGNGILNENYNPRIFLHDTEKNESREITTEEAQTQSLNSLLTSPDGISVSSDYRQGDDFLFPFDGGAYRGYYLMKGGKKSKLNLFNSGDTYYYQDNFQFIGWVTPGRN